MTLLVALVVSSPWRHWIHRHRYDALDFGCVIIMDKMDRPLVVMTMDAMRETLAVSSGWKHCTGCVITMDTVHKTDPCHHYGNSTLVISCVIAIETVHKTLAAASLW